MARERTLFAGPYAGEWGWELCLWNPHLRHRAQSFDRVVIAAPATSRYLYEDFAHEFLPVEVEPGTSDFLFGKALPSARVVPPHATILDPHSGFAQELVRRELNRFAKGEGLDPLKIWRWMGPGDVAGLLAHPNVAGLRPEVCVAFRPPKVFSGHTYPEKAYPFALCAEVVARLCAEDLVVAAVGGTDNYCPPGAIDLRGTPLELQCAALSGARAAVGPSSGPLHLAHLCRTGVVTWYCRPRNESAGRYDGQWNPFQAPINFLTPLLPTPQEVVRATLETLK